MAAAACLISLKNSPFPSSSSSFHPSSSLRFRATLLNCPSRSVFKISIVSSSLNPNPNPNPNPPLTRCPDYIQNQIPDPNYVGIFDTTIRDDFVAVKSIDREVGNAVDDTTGYVPDICEIEKDIRRACGAVKYVKMSRIHIFIHGQNDLGLCTANTKAEASAGTRQVDEIIRERAGNASIQEFIEWKRIHKKEYANENEEEKRFNIFVENKRILKKVDKYSDTTQQEIEQILLRKKYMLPNENVKILIDHRLNGCVSPVLEGETPCCASIAAVGAVESIYAIKSGELVPFSVQKLLDCHVGWTTCDIEDVYNNIIQYGLCKESDYPFNGGKKQDCVLCDAFVFIDRFNRLVYNEKAMFQVIKNQPFVCSVVADDSWESAYGYESLVLDMNVGELNERKIVDHGVLVVGMISFGPKEFWIVKNN